MSLLTYILQVLTGLPPHWEKCRPENAFTQSDDVFFSVRTDIGLTVEPTKGVDRHVPLMGLYRPHPAAIKNKDSR